MLKRSWHAPPHLQLDNTPYFITSAIYRKRYLLNSPELKSELAEIIRQYFEKYNWELHHWVILDNHYHLLGKSRIGSDLKHIFRDIHSTSGILISQIQKCEKPIWWNYWDYCPRNEHDYMTHANYLMYNPVRHGYVADLRDWPFSSFHKTLSGLGREKLAEQFRTHRDYKTLVIQDGHEDDY